MLENPEIQRRAQEELDSVLEPGRLPDFDDEEKLPYVTAIIRETMRIHPVAPMVIFLTTCILSLTANGTTHRPSRTCTAATLTTYTMGILSPEAAS